jgi:hypothetical protein
VDEGRGRPPPRPGPADAAPPEVVGHRAVHVRIRGVGWRGGRLPDPQREAMPRAGESLRGDRVFFGNRSRSDRPPPP